MTTAVDISLAYYSYACADDEMICRSRVSPILVLSRAARLRDRFCWRFYTSGMATNSGSEEASSYLSLELYISRVSHVFSSTDLRGKWRREGGGEEGAAGGGGEHVIHKML